MRIAGAQARQVPVDETLLAWLAQTPIATGQSLLAQAGQPAPSLSDLTSGLLYAAHDASVDVPAEVTPGAIWHTAVGHLARQGARLGDIATYLGQLNPQQAAMYSALAPAGTRLGWGQVQRLLPAAQSPWT